MISTWVIDVTRFEKDNGFEKDNAMAVPKNHVKMS
jgi:hypothetical protein